MYRIAIDINDTIRDFTRQFGKMYKKVMDPNFDIDYDDITDPDLFNVYPFLNKNGEQDRELYNFFLYEDCAYEIYGRAEIMERGLGAELILWAQNTMRNFDDNKNPDIIIVSPFEMNLSIQSTLAFLSKIGCRFRDIYFPIDSQTIWDKCDLLITANPKLIESAPEGKITIKINTPYNKDVKATYEFDTMTEVIKDTEKKLIKIVEEYNNGNA